MLRNVVASFWHHLHGTYCLECRKTVCMCSVKDHFVCQHNNVCKCKVDIEVADGMAAYVVFNILILELLLLSITALPYLSILQTTDSVCLDFYLNGCDQGISGEKIYCYQMTSCFASCDNDMQLNSDEPHNTHSVIILILFFTILLSVVCNNFENADVQATHIKVAYSLKEARCSLTDEFEESSESERISNVIGLIPGRATRVHIGSRPVHA